MSEGTAKDRGLRSFVAVPLPAPVRAAILAAVHQALPDAGNGLAARLPDIRWARRPENLHVTLKFLGQVEAAKLARFTEELAVALRASGISGFDIQLRGFGAFPSSRDAQVIWVGVDDPDQRLGQVAAIVDEVAARAPLQLPTLPALGRRPFRAHVTVGRAPRRTRRSPACDATASLAGAAELAFGRVTVNEICVYESITGGEASTYILRGKATLEGAIHGDGQDRDQGRN
jgi:2'-5' RNA ligase